MIRISSGPPSSGRIPYAELGSNRLTPRAGADNLVRVRDEIWATLVCLGNILGKEFNGLITAEQPLYGFVKNEILAILSLVLTQCPLDGDDGELGQRTYYAHPMSFGSRKAHFLRAIGEFMRPEAYSPSGIRRIILDNRRLYKLEVRVPSNLLGFSLTGFSSDKNQLQTDQLIFECYDGGQVFPGSKGELHVVAEVRFGLEQNPTFDIDLSHCSMMPNDIDRY
jgi:hypothetical protein